MAGHQQALDAATFKQAMLECNCAEMDLWGSVLQAALQIYILCRPQQARKAMAFKLIGTVGAH